MAQHKKKKRKKQLSSGVSHSAKHQPAVEPDITVVDERKSEWSKTIRCFASFVIGIYLVIVVLGPLSNPIPSRHLTLPLARFVAPVHQSLFLGHGYRFFGPDPGPSHILYFNGTKDDGTVVQGVFPDRKNHSPRLLYHRWFMLSETLFNESTLTRSFQEEQQLKLAYEQQIQQLSPATQSSLIAQLRAERDAELAMNAENRKRLAGLAEAIGSYIRQEFECKSVELSFRERVIPTPEEIQAGAKLDDPAFLSPPIAIGRMSDNGFSLAGQDQILPGGAE